MCARAFTSTARSQFGWMTDCDAACCGGRGRPATVDIKINICALKFFIFFSGALFLYTYIVLKIKLQHFYMRIIMLGGTVTSKACIHVISLIKDLQNIFLCIVNRIYVCVWHYTATYFRNNILCAECLLLNVDIRFRMYVEVILYIYARVEWWTAAQSVYIADIVHCAHPRVCRPAGIIYLPTAHEYTYIGMANAIAVYFSCVV